MKICDEFKKYVPFDERAYSQKATIYKEMEQIDKVIHICLAGMKEIPRAPQLGLTLADALLGTGRYAEAVQASSEALEATAELQPSANQATILWVRANAYDSLVFWHLRHCVSRSRNVVKSYLIAIT